MSGPEEIEQDCGWHREGLRWQPWALSLPFLLGGTSFVPWAMLHCYTFSRVHIDLWRIISNIAQAWRESSSFRWSLSLPIELLRIYQAAEASIQSMTNPWNSGFSCRELKVYNQWWTHETLNSVLGNGKYTSLVRHVQTSQNSDPNP